VIGADDAEIPPGGEPVPVDVPWQPWTPLAVADRLSAVRVPWGVAGGWAVDLFRGSETRAHEDLEIAVPLASFPTVEAALTELTFDVIGSARRWPVGSPAYDVLHQTWGRRGDGVYVVDVFREPHDGDTWICRRDPSLRRPYKEVYARTDDGIPYVVPEIVLLFKAKRDAPKDRHDLAGALPLMRKDQLHWLRAALDQVHPGHLWLKRL
jgi:hypothetical protein